MISKNEEVVLGKYHKAHILIVEFSFIYLFVVYFATLSVASIM